MATPVSPARPPAPRPLPSAPTQMKAGPPPIGAASRKTFTTSLSEAKTAFKMGIYGTGGVGKTSLAMAAPGPVRFIDLDDSLGALQPVEGVSIVRGVESWQDLLDALRQEDLWKNIRSIVVDTATKAEEFAIAHTIRTVTGEKGKAVTSVEGYGYGKGYKHVYETYLALFVELERHNRAGRNVIMVCHDKKEKVPNPFGDDYLRYGIRLQDQSNGNISDKLKEWCDHLFFIGYDYMLAAKDGKNAGNNGRTIYPVEQSTFVAKSRTLRDPIPYPEGDVALWNALFGQ